MEASCLAPSSAQRLAHREKFPRLKHLCEERKTEWESAGEGVGGEEGEGKSSKRERNCS